jgi:hypothetical protein
LVQAAQINLHGQEVTCVNLDVRTYRAGGTSATIRQGAPEPPTIFTGSATTVNPAGGKRSSWATFSSAGTFARQSRTWVALRNGLNSMDLG